MENGPSGDSRCSSEAASLPMTRQVCVMMEIQGFLQRPVGVQHRQDLPQPFGHGPAAIRFLVLGLLPLEQAGIFHRQPDLPPDGHEQGGFFGGERPGSPGADDQAPEQAPLGCHRHGDHQLQASAQDSLFPHSLRILGHQPDDRVLRVDGLPGERGVERQPGDEGNEPLRQSPMGHEHQGLGLLFQPERRSRFHAGGLHRLLERGFHDLPEIQRTAHHGGECVERCELPRALGHAPFQVLVGLLQLRLGLLALADVHVGADDAQRAPLRVALHDLAARRDPDPSPVPAAEAELDGEVPPLVHVALHGLLGLRPVVGVQKVGPASVLRGRAPGS